MTDVFHLGLVVTIHHGSGSKLWDWDDIGRHDDKVLMGQKVDVDLTNLFTF